jgi:hypothetical protein
VRALALSVLVPLAAWADCASWSWKVFPQPGSTVPTNARFVVQAYGDAQPIVASIATRHPRLVTQDGAQLPLEVLEVNVGELLLTQAVLRPKGALTVGTRYTLRFDQPEGPARFSLPRDESASWFAGPADFDAPVWVTRPEAQPGKIVRYGCGPLVEARVAVALADGEPVLFRAHVSRPDGGVREFLLAPDKGEVAIGHGMCSGAFRLDGGAWSLELTAVDFAGNATPAPGSPLRFKGVEPADRPDAG